MKKPFVALIIFCCIAFISCGKKKDKNTGSYQPLFTLMENCGIDFTNKITNTKALNIFNYRNFYNGGGTAVGDINNDGFADVFFTANMGSNKLYLNNKNFQFTDISDKAGFVTKTDWSTGVAMVDINNDGWLDVYVCNAGFINGIAPKNQLYINNHNLTFTESAAEYGLTNEGGYCTHAAFFDFDLDGDLDCYILNNSFIPVNTLNYANKRELRAKDWPVPDYFKGGGDKLLKNEDGKFIDVSEKAGIFGSLIGFGLGVTVGDVNNDQFPDIYVSNDFFEKDYLYINQKNGTFKEELEERIQHISHSSMGADMGDLDNDGNPEIFVTEMLPGDEIRFKTTASFENIDIKKLKENAGFFHQFMQNTLQHNNGDGTFSETAFYSGVAATDWSWGGLIFDADNDGLSDLYVCNGIYNDLTDQDFIDFFANDIIQNMPVTGKKQEIDEIIEKMPSISIPNKAYKNIGNMKFADKGTDWGFEKPSFSNGAAYADLDNDGDLDLVINNLNEKCFVYKNNSRQLDKNNFIGIRLKGKEKNKFAIGSAIKVFSGNQIQTREVIPTRGYQSSADYQLIIGTGKSTVDSMIVIWPDRSYEIVKQPAINQFHNIQQGESKIIYQPVASTITPLLTVQQPFFDKHSEDDYTDFYFERNVPGVLSTEGPRAATGDVNGDGLADVYIGGAAGKSGQVYLQTAKGFTKKAQPAFDYYASFEDVAALFFDCEKDGDLDLFVGSGGNTHPAGSRELMNRLYKNDGNGNFSIDSNAFANDKGMNTAIAVAEDFDLDGDPDLFIGSRSMPLEYGSSPVSYLYLNNGSGHFTDIAATKNQDIANIGMVTGALWSNVAGDEKKELVITGEWMTPRIFSFNGDHFVEVNTNLANMFGWWQTVACTDVDGDGDNDLLLGNIGENFYLQPDSLHPVKIWLGDFDDNQVKDKILTRTVDGKDLPVFLKRDLTDQLPNLKKQNLRHNDYAKKSIQDLLTKEELSKGSYKSFNYTSSCMAINEGNGKFAIKKFPYQVQLSSVNAIVSTDVNNDGFNDLIMGGNKFGFLPQFCRVDASYGSVLLNDGKGNFTCLPKSLSGLNVKGEVRDIKLIKKGKNQMVLFLQNNDYPLLYQLTGSGLEIKKPVIKN
ncbi:MAG: FG-GAP-like repeat-containing protein [Bacteroidota bacterium]